MSVPAFVVPDFQAPLDVAGWDNRVLPDSTVKGWVMAGMLDAVKAAGKTLPGVGPFTSFKDYPGITINHVAIRAASTLYPGMPQREALRRVGRLAYPTLTTTLAGRVLFGVLGKDIHAVLKLAAKAYDLAGKPGRCTTVELGPNHVVLRLDDVFSYTDCYQVGVLEGALEACGRTGTVQYREETPRVHLLRAQWR